MKQSQQEKDNRIIHKKRRKTMPKNMGGNVVEGGAESPTRRNGMMVLEESTDLVVEFWQSSRGAERFHTEIGYPKCFSKD